MSLILFQSPYKYTDSQVFELNQQKTVVALGLQPDDYITFEIVIISDAARMKICGCRLIESGMSSVVQLQPVMCPSCNNGEPRYVRITAHNPMVVLDAPQGALLRAIYHGTGLDLQTVTVTVSDSDTGDLTSTLRGCPPVYCEDMEETWTPTGLHRCTTTNVELEEISNCGNKRWVECGPTLWVDTGNRRCFGGNYQMEERNQCNAARWTTIEAVAWVDTCNVCCFDDNGTIRVQHEQTNQCGHRRMQVRGEPTWSTTGNYRCVGEVLEREERSTPCDLVRWVNSGFVTWTDTGLNRCTETAYERQQVNNCGATRWVFQSALAWTPTGVYDCRSNINWREEQNQCGTKRFINTGEACGTTTHTMTSLAPTAASVVEGQVACWNFTLNSAVVGTPLTINFVLSGADQTRNAYASPRSVTLPVGQSGGQLCITTTDDLVIDGNEQLCITPQLNDRLTNAPGASCILVLDNDLAAETPYSITSITRTTPDPIIEGQQVCWQFTVDRPVETVPLTINTTWSGSDFARHGYANGSVTIPVGQTTGNLCVFTVDDVIVDGTEQLCMASIVANGRITGSPALPACVDVLDNDTLTPGDSAHTIVSITPVTTPITEGQQACWLVTLDGAVATTNLTINFSLSGADQTRHGYPPPSLVIPVGQSSGTVCVTSTDDAIIDGMEQLCITAITSGRITAVPAASCINVNDNDVTASVHTISCVTPPPQALEGTTFCWLFELDAPVAVSPLTVSGTLSGTEQDIHGYANPSVVVPVGQSSGQLCVPTIDDTLVEGSKTLCLTFATSARVTGVTDAPCGASQASLIFTNVVGIDQTIPEGGTLNVRVSLSAPAPVGGVSGTVAFSGSEKTANPASYLTINFNVPEGATFLDTGVPIVDDAFIDGASALYGTLAVSTGGWVVGLANAGATVTDNDVEVGGGGGGGSGEGSGCFISGTLLRTPTGYVNVNALLPGDELLGFGLPQMPSDYDPEWTAWNTDSLAGMSYLATRVISSKPFREETVVIINEGPATTQDHRYFVFNGQRYEWVQAKDLNERYSLVTSTGNVPVTTVESYEGGYTFFALDVEAPDTLIAKTRFGDVLAHNRKCADCPGAPGPTGLL